VDRFRVSPQTSNSLKKNTEVNIVEKDAIKRFPILAVKLECLLHIEKKIDNKMT